MFSWDNLPKPFFVLAPMHDVTDRAFRELVSILAKPDVMMSEFVSVDGLTHIQSQEKIIRYYLGFSQKERPLIAQIWGSDPDLFLRSAKMIREMGFDGIDINMGCPEKKVVAGGGGAALIKDSQRAIEVIEATKQGAGELPVSVKTRLGFDVKVGEKWAKALASAHPDAVTIHARTRKEKSIPPADWDTLGNIAPIIQGEGIVFIGNGDVISTEDAEEKVKKYGVDGVMIGRGVLGNPWIFSSQKDTYNSVEKKISILLSHAYLFEKYFKNMKHFSMIKKHVKGYVSGFPGAKELRCQLMNCSSAEEMRDVIVKEGYRVKILDEVSSLI